MIGLKSYFQERYKMQLKTKNKYQKLPHIDIEGYYQFITFRTYDSLDSYLEKLYELNISNKQKQQQIDTYLDTSQKGAYLTNDILLYLYDYFISQDKILYDLIAFSIMPNHIHILFKPYDKLSKVIQKIKGNSSLEINKRLNKSGKFWASNYYDKAIRGEKHFMMVYEYIKNNPLKIGVKDGRFYGLYEKE
jgi:REP element-mobilizing transposase RayT